MLQIKFDCNRPAGLGDIHVWKCERTDARTARVPSYKLTLWAFGSGELRMLIRLCGCTVWSQPLLFTFGINRFSHDLAHLIPNMVTFKMFNPKWHIRGWVQDWWSMCYFLAFMIFNFSIPSFILQQNSDSLQVNIYLTRKHCRITYTDSRNFFRVG